MSIWGKVVIIKNKSNKEITLRDTIDKFRSEFIKILEIEKDLLSLEKSIEEINKRFDTFISYQDCNVLDKKIKRYTKYVVILQKDGIDCWFKMDLIEYDKYSYLKDDVLIESTEIIY